MRMQPHYHTGLRVQYNSLLSAGAAKGTIVSINNDVEPHVYTIEPDSCKGENKFDVVKEQHIYGPI